MTCPSLEDFAHSTVNSTNATYQSVLELECDTGYRFYDDVTTLELTCTAHGNWSVDVSELTCSCKPYAIFSYQLVVIFCTNVCSVDLSSLLFEPTCRYRVPLPSCGRQQHSSGRGNYVRFCSRVHVSTRLLHQRYRRHGFP